MSDWSLCPICCGKLKQWKDAGEGTLLESEETCPNCDLYLFEFHYGHSEQRYGVLFTAWSYDEDSPKDWREQREEARAIYRSQTGFALFKEVRKTGDRDAKLVMADWCAENGLLMTERRLREEAAMSVFPYCPPCRVCGKTENVICYPDDHSLTIYPDCCDNATHPDGETGHQWEYDKWDGWYCRYCGIPRNCTEYEEDYIDRG